MATPAADCSAIRRSCSHGVSSSSVRYFWSAHLAAWPGGLPGGPALAPTGPVARTPHRAVVSLAPITGVGLVIGLLTRWLGNPGDVELLVDNIHVIGRPESARSLRSLIPVSLLGIAVGGAAGPEARWPRPPARSDPRSRCGQVGRPTGSDPGDHPHGERLHCPVRHPAGRGHLRPRDPAPPWPGVLRGADARDHRVAVRLRGLGTGRQRRAGADLRLPPRAPTLQEGHLGWAVAAGVVGAVVATTFTYLVDGSATSSPTWGCRCAR